MGRPSIHLGGEGGRALFERAHTLKGCELPGLARDEGDQLQDLREGCCRGVSEGVAWRGGHWRTSLTSWHRSHR
mgnify:CR=1 FL=1